MSESRERYDPCGHKLVETEKLRQGDFESVISMIVALRWDEWFMDRLGEFIDDNIGSSP